MTTFALIHGAHHGAWCWDFFVPELHARGHQAVPIDLPIDDPKADLSRYVAVTLEALAEVGDDLVVVAHSLGAITGAVVAARRPVRHTVFFACPIPEPGVALAEQLRKNPMAKKKSGKIEYHDGLPVQLASSPDEAVHRYYHDCSQERQQYALARLRPQSLAPYAEPSPLTAWPDVPMSYIVCTDDHAVYPDLQRATARERLGVEPVEIPGSHSPFLSRPAALADLVTRVSLTTS
jgi:pimeloyl-ACP methyl ester carboxylesterase